MSHKFYLFALGFSLIMSAFAAYDPAEVEIESTAVAEQFYEPDIEYDTPALLQSERQDFTRYQEMLDYIYTLQRRTPTLQIRMLVQSQQERDIPLLIFTQDGLVDSAYLLKSQRPTVLIIGHQHGNEPASGEASLAIAGQLITEQFSYLLDRINILIVPWANPDGAEAFSRVTANGVDLNRDHLLLTTPEAQALARIAYEYLPDVVIDVHEFTVLGRWVEKFGVAQKYDAMVQYATIANLPAEITDAAETWFRLPLLDALVEENLSAFWYYTTSSKDMEDKKISMGGVKPNVGRNVNGLRNSISFLIELRGVGLGRAHYKRRVRTGEAAVSILLKQTYEHAEQVVELTRNASQQVQQAACDGELVVVGAQTLEQKELTFLDANTGEAKTITVDWNSALDITPKLTRSRPCGYAFAASETLAAEQLRALGVTVHTLLAPASLQAERYVVSASAEGERQDVRGTIADNHSILKLDVATEQTEAEVPAGIFYVSMAQPLGNIVAAALEPDTENGYVANRILELEAGIGLLRIMASPPVPLMVWD